MKAWIKFDIEQLNLLKEHYEQISKTLEDQLPHAKLDYKKQVVDFFEKNVNVQLKTERINELGNDLQKLSENQQEYYLLLSITYLFKIKYSLKNYINYVLKNEVNGIIVLRHWWDEWVFENHQPIPTSPEILACVIEHSNNISLGGE